MKAPSRIILQTLFFLSAAGALGAYYVREPLSRFFKINRAYYYANLSEWGPALEILDRLPPEGTQARTIAQLKVDALLQVAEPFRAIETWESYLGSNPEAESGDYEPLYGFALLLGQRKADAHAYFARPDEPFARAMSAELAKPSWDSYQTLLEMTKQRYEKRWLYVAAVEWMKADAALIHGGSDDALRTLAPLIDRFPYQTLFLFSDGLAHLGAGDAGLATSYLVAAFNVLAAKCPEEKAARIRESWRDQITRELVPLVYARDLATALGVMRSAARPLQLDLKKPVAIALNQESISPAAAFELESFLRENPSLVEASGPPRVLGEHRAWLDWFRASRGAGSEGAGVPLPPSVAALTPLAPRPATELTAHAALWSKSLAPPAPEIGRRVILLQMKAAAMRGIGAAYGLAIGWKRESGFTEERPSWHAFDVPLTIGDPVEIALSLNNASLPGIDDPSQDKEGRRLIILDALLVDFKRKG